MTKELYVNAKRWAPGQGQAHRIVQVRQHMLGLHNTLHLLDILESVGLEQRLCYKSLI